MNDEISDAELISVYQASDEVTANLVAGVLEEAGIRTYIKSRQVPWMDGVMVNAEGYWGDVMVPQRERKLCLQLIMDFQLAILDDEDDEPTEEVN
jgi:hypothetical protein